jgi:hypothetical protein
LLTYWPSYQKRACTVCGELELGEGMVTVDDHAVRPPAACAVARVSSAVLRKGGLRLGGVFSPSWLRACGVTSRGACPLSSRERS